MDGISDLIVNEWTIALRIKSRVRIADTGCRDNADVCRSQMRVRVLRYDLELLREFSKLGSIACLKSGKVIVYFVDLRPLD